MSITSFLHTQHSASRSAIDDTLFDTAALVFTIEKTFDAPVHAVWTAIDDEHAWKWLPFPGTGVKYDSPARGVGMVREMGSPFGVFRVLWVEREKFWRYEPNQRITFGVVSGNWMQYLLVRQYGEDKTFADLGDGRTKVVWTIAVTPRLPLRFSTWFPPVWKAAYRLFGIGPLFQRRVDEIVRTTKPPLRSMNTKGIAAAEPGKQRAEEGTR
ncbi:SRPBCC family protein [Nocardia mexicana]|uniref:Polyketide cyclase/dehydrase/lipid transport protein n=1 Tax=Nocardia mexicana TaxID=279262 RepID=A0A370HAY9_9NOCA|nr:SRPBCC family protein [Nocardia mexicana]RDI54092.1 polyketide cyclase/dehydrase/lipid transport protein [Nocardia mexicana]